MATEGLVCTSLVSVFIATNASSLKIELDQGIVCWRRICTGHRMFYDTQLDNHPFYPCQLKDLCVQVLARSFLWFYLCCVQIQKIELQLPVERQFLPENSVESWYQYNWGVYGEKEFTSNTERALQTCAAVVVLNQNLQLLFWIKIVNVPEFLRCGAGIQADLKFKFIRFYFPRCQGIDSGIRMYFKPSDLFLWSPQKEHSAVQHTESAIHKEHLAPCRFKCWTNLYSIGTSQPLTQLQSRYNVEIRRVSLPNDQEKWDFRMDSISESEPVPKPKIDALVWPDASSAIFWGAGIIFW